MDFLVLPDHPASDALGRCLPASPARRTLRHPSGRPWITGHWSPDEAVPAEAGPRRALLLGTTPATPGTLARLLPGPGHLDGIGRRARRLPGSAFLLTAADGDLRCRGDLAGVRLLHHARIAGVTVAGNRPQDLAALARAAAAAGLPTGAPGLGFLDEDAPALRLLFPFAPLPLALRPAWHAVSAVPPGHHLTLYANGRHSLARWWRPPEPDIPLEHAAEHVAGALADAVAARAGRAQRQAAADGTTRRGTLSAGLSGSTGATGLCFLAAREDVRLLTTSWASRDPGDEDTRWSARGAATLAAAERQRERQRRRLTGQDTGQERDGNGGRRRNKGTGKDAARGRRGRRGAAGAPPPPPPEAHLSLPYADVPTCYTPPTDTRHGTPADPAGPLAVFREAARLAHRARLVAEHGSRLHLVAAGADALFGHRPAALNSLAHGDLRTAARRAWTAHHLCHWTARDTLRTLLGGRSYARWLAGSAPRAPGPGRRAGGADWEPPPALPPWAHPDAVATVRRLLREAADEAPEPFAPLRAQHDILRAALHAAETVRGADALTAAHGVGHEAPFLDDAVVEAALALDLADRGRPGVHQPLLTRALRGVVPDGVLGRGTHTGPGPEAHAGLRAHRDALAALCDDSPLAARGLIHPDVLRRHLTAPQPPALRALDATLATEYWLRAVAPDHAPVPAVPVPAAPAPAVSVPAVPVPRAAPARGVPSP
ncbi:asparagine synthase-related protein [Streptomyces lydicus]|uniref:asparagine synthase-related protein n=1 Tax=Streptomyces lydicus TaxID=47763 RepID=UPI003788238E